MKIYLHPEMKVKDIKEMFSKAYPYLKIEFFTEKHQPQQGTEMSKKAADNAMLVDVLGVMREGEITIEPHQSVAELEQLFQRKFNLPVQVFRKAKETWLETTETDNLSLIEQNKLGEEAAKTFVQEQRFYDD